MRIALVLAGGEGRRFGRRDKLLEPLGGAPLLIHALRSAYAAAPRTLLILPPALLALVCQATANTTTTPLTKES